MKLTLPITLAACFAGLSAAYWLIELQDQSAAAITLAVAASVCVSSLGFVCAYFMRSHGWLLVIPALIFMGADTYQNALGYQAMQSLTVSGEVAAAQTRLDEARAELAALPLPNATGQIRRAETWETLNTTLTARVDQAKADLAAVTQPQAPMLYVGLAMAIIQIALAITFACFGKRKDKPKAEPVAQATPANVVPIRRRPEMDAKDLKAWSKIAN